MNNEVWEKTLNGIINLVLKNPDPLLQVPCFYRHKKKTASFPTVFWLELLTKPYFRSKRSRFITLVQALEKS
jgi:hypothetical protein